MSNKIDLKTLPQVTEQWSRPPWSKSLFGKKFQSWEHAIFFSCTAMDFEYLDCVLNYISLDQMIRSKNTVYISQCSGMFSSSEQPMSDPNEEQIQEQIANLLTVVLVLVMPTIQKILHTLFSPGRTRWPYHTSILSEEAWVLELLHGHLEQIQTELGVHAHVFLALISELCLMEYSNSKFVSLEEQLAIFLYAYVTGLTICHVGERFQHANKTIWQVSHIFIIFSILSESSVISKKWPSSSQNLHFIQSLFATSQLMIQFFNIFETIPSYSHSL